MIADEKIIINKYLPLRYANNGRGDDAVDCFGLIICVYRDLGAQPMDLTADNISDVWKDWAETSAPEFPDIVVFGETHAGIVLRDGRLLHCSRSGVNVTTIEAMRRCRGVEVKYYKYRGAMRGQPQ